jgi:RES domain
VARSRPCGGPPVSMGSKGVSKQGRPGGHPDPPADLATHSLPLLTTTQPWFRIYRLSHQPLYFGKSGDGRFDLPGREAGVLYVAADEAGAFIETLGHVTGTRVITVSALRSRGVAEIHVQRPLRLVDLTGLGLAHIGADERLCSGEYTVAQRWSLALFRHPQKPDGLCYRSRHDPGRLGAALYQRAARKLRVARHVGLGEREAAWLLGTLQHLSAFLIDDTQ